MSQLLDTIRKGVNYVRPAIALGAPEGARGLTTDVPAIGLDHVRKQEIQKFGIAEAEIFGNTDNGTSDLAGLNPPTTVGNQTYFSLKITWYSVSTRRDTVQ